MTRDPRLPWEPSFNRAGAEVGYNGTGIEDIVELVQASGHIVVVRSDTARADGARYQITLDLDADTAAAWEDTRRRARH